jgi:hypothetical protein
VAPDCSTSFRVLFYSLPEVDQINIPVLLLLLLGSGSSYSTSAWIEHSPGGVSPPGLCLVHVQSKLGAPSSVTTAPVGVCRPPTFRASPPAAAGTLEEEDVSSARRSRYGTRPAVGARPAVCARPAPIALLSTGIHPPLVRGSVHNQRPLAIFTMELPTPAAAPGDLLLVLESPDLDVRFTSRSSSLDMASDIVALLLLLL